MTSKIVVLVAAVLAAIALVHTQSAEPYVTMTSLGMYFKDNPHLGQVFAQSASKLFDVVQEYGCFLIDSAVTTLNAQLAQSPSATMSCASALSTAQNAVMQVLNQPPIQNSIPANMMNDARTALGDVIGSVINPSCNSGNIAIADLIARLEDVKASLCYTAQVSLQPLASPTPAPALDAAGLSIGNTTYQSVNAPPSATITPGDAFFQQLMSAAQYQGLPANTINQLPPPQSENQIPGAAPTPTYVPGPAQNVVGVSDLSAGNYASYSTDTPAPAAPAPSAPAADAATIAPSATFAPLSVVQQNSNIILPFDATTAPALPLASNA